MPFRSRPFITFHIFLSFANFCKFCPSPISHDPCSANHFQEKIMYVMGCFPLSFVPSVYLMSFDFSKPSFHVTCPSNINYIDMIINMNARTSSLLTDSVHGIPTIGIYFCYVKSLINQLTDWWYMSMNVLFTSKVFYCIYQNNRRYIFRMSKMILIWDFRFQENLKRVYFLFYIYGK